jgi:peptide/nickel transport system substrate-binding protein
MLMKLSFRSCVSIVLVYFTTLQGCHRKSSEQAVSDRKISFTGQKYFKVPEAENTDPRWSGQNIIVVHWTGDPESLHPTNRHSALAAELFKYIHRTIIRMDLRTLQLVPDLARSLPAVSADGKVYDYLLSEDIRWDDGEQLTASDVLFSLKAAVCPLTDNSHRRSGLNNLVEVITFPEDPFKFRLVMKGPDINNISFLLEVPVLQRKRFDPAGILEGLSFASMRDTAFGAGTYPGLAKWAREFNSSRNAADPEYIRGLGPYRLSRWENGQVLILEKKSAKEKGPDKIIYRIVKDPAALLLEFRSQAIDGSSYISHKNFKKLTEDPEFNRNYNAYIIDSYLFSYIGLNMKPDGERRKRLFDDQRVRRAMALLTPVDAINKTLADGKSRRTAGPVIVTRKEYNTGLSLLPYDPGKAAALLEQAGWKDSDGDKILDKEINGSRVPFIFDIYYMTSQPDWKDMAMIISESYGKAGLRANLVPLDISSFGPRIREHDFDMFLSSWSFDSMNDDYSQLWHTRSWKNNGYNYTGFGNTKTDQLIDSINITLDSAKRTEMIKRLQVYIYNEQPYIFLFNGTKRIILHKRFKDAEIYQDRPYVLWNSLNLLKKP